MKHLSEREILELIYNESDDRCDTAAQHLSACRKCSDRVSELRQVMGCLEAFQLPARDFQSVPPDVRASLAETENGAAMLANAETERWTAKGVIAKVLAASIVFFIGGIGFALGGHFQSRNHTAAIDAKLKEIKNDRSDLSFRQSMQSSLQRLEEALAASAPNDDKQRIQELEQRLAGLLDNQFLLRSELQALALNAESELSRTNRNIALTVEKLDRLMRYTSESY